MALHRADALLGGALVVPGSQQVKVQAEKLGLDKVFIDAGAPVKPVVLPPGADAATFEIGDHPVHVAMPGEGEVAAVFALVFLQPQVFELDDVLVEQGIRQFGLGSDGKEGGGGDRQRIWRYP